MIPEADLRRGLSLEAVGLWAHIQVQPDDILDIATLETMFPSSEVSELIQELLEARLLTIGEPDDLVVDSESKRIVTKAIVYVMQSADLFKIGVTGNLRKRRKSIQTSNPYRVSVVWSMEFMDASIIESRMHRMLSQHRLTGEWFKCSRDEIDAVILEVTKTPA